MKHNPIFKSLELLLLPSSVRLPISPPDLPIDYLTLGLLFVSENDHTLPSGRYQLRESKSEIKVELEDDNDYQMVSGIMEFCPIKTETIAPFFS